METLLGVFFYLQSSFVYIPLVETPIYGVFFISGYSTDYHSDRFINPCPFCHAAHAASRTTEATVLTPPAGRTCLP